MSSQPTNDLEIWLASSPNWKNGPGAGWKPVRILGSRKSRVALFEHDGSGRAPPLLRQIVVKEVAEDTSRPASIFPRSIFHEGEIQYKLAYIAGSPHIVRAYGAGRRDDEAGVVRILMEYCPGGDLDRILSYSIPAENKMAPIEHVGDIANRNARLKEIDVWAVFHCLALGLHAMEYGTENTMAEKTPFTRDRVEITHFDLTPDNCFLGFRDENHQRIPIVKIGDFGEAVETPRNLPANLIGVNSNRGQNLHFQPPEENEYDIPLQNPLGKGAYSNVFQVGCIMNCIMTGTRHVFNGPEMERSPFLIDHLGTEGHLQFQLHAAFSDFDDIKTRASLYSKQLMNLVKVCCSREPGARPTTLSLVTRTRQGIDDAIRATKKIHMKYPYHGFPMHYFADPNRPAIGPQLQEPLPEPPPDWLIDPDVVAEFDVDIGDILADMTPSQDMGSPVGSSRKRNGWGTMFYSLTSAMLRKSP